MLPCILRINVRKRALFVLLVDGRFHETNTIYRQDVTKVGCGDFFASSFEQKAKNAHIHVFRVNENCFVLSHSYQLSSAILIDWRRF